MTISNQNSEKRKQPRKSYLKTVTIQFNNHSISGIIHNMSLGGIYIEAHYSFIVGQTLTISYLGSDRKKEFKIQGEVVRTDPKGFAMKYI